MYFDGPPGEPRRSGGRLTAMAISAFAVTAIGLVIGLRGADAKEPRPRPGP